MLCLGTSLETEGCDMGQSYIEASLSAQGTQCVGRPGCNTDTEQWWKQQHATGQRLARSDHSGSAQSTLLTFLLHFVTVKNSCQTQNDNSKQQHKPKLQRKSWGRSCTVLYCTVLYRTALYRTILYRTVLHCTVLYCTVLYRTALYRTILYRTVLHCTVLHCTVLCLYWWNFTPVITGSSLEVTMRASKPQVCTSPQPLLVLRFLFYSLCHYFIYFLTFALNLLLSSTQAQWCAVLNVLSCL
jgi:hypothetical protein